MVTKQEFKEISYFILTNCDCIKIWVGLICFFASMFIFTQVVLTFLIGFLCVSSIATGVSNIAYSYLSQSRPTEFSYDEMKELPAVLAYYQTTHRRSLVVGWIFWWICKK